MQQRYAERNGGGVRRVLVGTLFALIASTVNAGAAEFNWNEFLGPFHNVMLHYPVGFVTMACVLEVYGWKSPSEELRRITNLTLWLAIVTTLIAALLGFARAAEGGYNEQILDAHKIYGIATIVLGIAAVAVAGPALKVGASAAVRWSYRFVLLTTFSVMAIAGHKGGDLTHGTGYLTKHAPPVLKEMLGEEVAEKRVSVIQTAKGGDAAAMQASPSGAAPTKPSLFAGVVWPAFEAKCIKCHGEEKHKGDYRMDTREAALTAGDSELEPIVPGKPDESFLVELIELPEDDDEVMPPAGKEPLTEEEKKAVRQWILDGASFDLTGVTSK